MKPYYEQDGITIYHGDCREVLPTLPKVDLVLTDPPYGLGNALNRPGHTDGNKWSVLYGCGAPHWDAVPFPNIQLVIDAAESAIVWGGNNYTLPPRRGWLIWDKVIRKFSSGHAEIAWTTIDQPIRAFSYSHGSLASEGKKHPTQKPLPLIKWCIGFFPDAQTILDPFMGSGTTLRAAKDLGRKAIGIEIEERYCEIAANRLAQGVLFGGQ